MRARTLLAGTLVAGAAAIVWQVSMPRLVTPATAAPMVEVKVPPLSAVAEQGRAAFEANCLACHGENAAGNEAAGPPLVHVIYEPSHHGDRAFHIAARNGARAHHWRFGNMPPVDGITDGQIDAIIVYVRELQRANGID